MSECIPCEHGVHSECELLDLVAEQQLLDRFAEVLAVAGILHNDRDACCCDVDDFSWAVLVRLMGIPSNSRPIETVDVGDYL